jgi:small subunit ribosomal protein S16
MDADFLINVVQMSFDSEFRDYQNLTDVSGASTMDKQSQNFQFAWREPDPLIEPRDVDMTPGRVCCIITCCWFYPFIRQHSSKESVLAVKIRLARHGAKKAPYYRVIVADARSPRDGRFIEEVGRYNPCAEPAYVKLDLEKIDTWIKNGAQPTETVTKLVAKAREGA